jgi:RecA/RadA recombinase
VTADWRVWRQLPAGPAGFTGRSAELATLHGWAAGGGAVIAVTGPAGAGKSALALHWAAGAAAAFPAGQLHLDLDGFGPDRPVAPVEALGILLRQVGVAPHRLPAALADRTAEWRTALAGRRVLVVLDNARDAEQVRPLLGATGVTLVTSRNQLRGLVIREGARRLRLDPLPRPEARALLTHAHPGDARGHRTDDPLAPWHLTGSVETLLDLCGGSPLALRAAAERATRLPGPPDPAPPPAPAVRGAAGGGGVLGLFDGLGVDVRAVLSWSYRVLDEPSGRLFRLLGLCPGGEVSVAGAAALTGLPLPRAAALLDRLANLHLVEERSLGRYRLDVLAAGYAAELVQTDPPGERRAALRRLLDRTHHADRDLAAPVAGAAFRPPRPRPPTP